MMTEASLSIGSIALAYFSTGAWIGSLDKDDTAMDVFWCGLAWHRWDCCCRGRAVDFHVADWARTRGYIAIAPGNAALISSGAGLVGLFP
ncbi:hypothetical protein [Methylocapsa aurea]|uniref:hypothetical protein n=1 Tax=Methylocapsa aurea TaxID=663610 RepID=UPI0012EB9385|nr:hypothetical protein [Methylocapsa aurea]